MAQGDLNTLVGDGYVSVPQTATTRTYKMCDGANLVDVQVSLVLTYVYRENTNINGCNAYNIDIKYKFVTDVPLTSDINVARKTWIRNNYCYVPLESWTLAGTDIVYLTSGSTGSTEIEIQDFIAGEDSCEDNGYCFFENEIDIELAAQSSLPTCDPQAGCDLAFTGSTITNPTFLGEDNGSITVFISGGTAPFTYSLNGGSPQASNVFNNLIAGSYAVYVEDSLGCYDIINLTVQAGEFRTGDFIVSLPNEVTAVENPIILNLRTAIANPNGIASVNTITIDGSISNVTISFALTFPFIYNAEFKSKGYPIRANYFLETNLTNEIGAVIGSNSVDEIATSLAEVLQNDSVISRLYFISNSGTTITLVAKTVGNQYDLTPTNVTIVGANVTLTNIVSGLVAYDGQLSADYSLYCELFVNPDLQFGATPNLANFKRVTELELPFNNDNLHTFDLSTVLKNLVSSPKIDFAFTGFTTLTTMDTTFFCKYGEKYPLIENSAGTKKKRVKGSTPVFYSINSALDFTEPNDMSPYLGTNISGTSIYTGLTFLNTAPNPKYISRGSKEFLYMLLRTNYPNYLDLRGDIYFYNGTSITGVTFAEITNSGNSINFGGVTRLTAGYDELGLAAYEASGNTKIRRVDFAVWQTPMTGGSSYLLSETRSYLLEIDEQPQKYDVAFLNKLGTYETFSFVGEVVEDQEITREYYQVPYAVNSAGQASTGFQYNSVYDTQSTPLITVNSGTIDEATYYYLMDMLASNRLYNYSNPDEPFLTIVGQAAVKSTNEAEYTVQVQFKETIFSNNVEK